MDDLSVLLPIWHSVTLKDLLGTPHYGNDANIYPDHTGAGVDISFKHGFRQCSELKSSTVRSSFSAKSCALPFLSPNKVKSLRDPCLQTLRNQKKKQTEFCTKLDLLLAHAKRKSYFHDVVHAAYSNLNDLDNEEECDKLSIPISVMELAETMPEHFPVPRANWRYTNGCLATLPNRDGESGGLLFHPGGTKMNRLMLTPFTETSSKKKTIVACEEEQKGLKFTDGKIYQIETVETQGTRLCCVRQEKTYHLVNLDVSEENEDFPFFFDSFSLEEEISNIAMSPFEAGQHVIITKDGLLFIQDANEKKTLWHLDEPLQHDPVVSDMWWGCSFGRCHPSLLCMDRMNLLLYDLRQKKKPTGIFSSVNPFMLKDEQLMVMKHWPGNDYQHLIASDHHLFICDERYPEQPVVLINHMMEGFPIYCDVAPYSSCGSNSEYVVLLGSQGKREVASFFLQSSTCTVQPLSLGPPLHLSNFGDSVQSLRLQGNAVDENITKRLSVPLVGVSAIPHTQKPGFTALQVSSLGDVFYQCFQARDSSNAEKTWKVSPGCILTPPERILPELNSWMNLALVKEKSPPRKTWNTIDKSDVLSRMLVPKGRSSQCVLCKDKTLLEGEEEVDCEICPSCGLQSDTSQQLIGAMKQSRVVIHSSSESSSVPTLNLVDLSKSTGPLSKKLLKVWGDENFMVSQNVEDTVQTLGNTIEINHQMDREPCPSEPSNEHTAPSVDRVGITDYMNLNSDGEKDSSRTPSIDGLVIQKNVRKLSVADGDDVIASSQPVRPLVGETLRTPTPKRLKKAKLQASAGF